LRRPVASWLEVQARRVPPAQAQTQARARPTPQVPQVPQAPQAPQAQPIPRFS